MLRTAVFRVHDDQLDRLRDWMSEVTRRTDEVRETFQHEGTRHEQVHLLEIDDRFFLLYVMEVEDVERSREAFQTSTFPIDQQHREVMASVVAERLPTEVILDATA